MASVKAWLDFQHIDVKIWRRFLESYEIIFASFCKIKKKDDLKTLDQWFQSDFGSTIRKRKPHHLIKDELVKLMKWKLTRGKFRPRLTQMITENSDSDIEKITGGSFECSKNPKQSIEKLCKLKAVGPATASAILTAYDPANYAFMADEAVSSVLPGKIDYTLKYYLRYLDEVTTKSKQLSELDSKKWTAHDVELALWTSKMAKQLNIDVPKNVPETKTKNGKRKSEEVAKETIKKQKTS